LAWLDRYRRVSWSTQLHIRNRRGGPHCPGVRSHFATLRRRWSSQTCLCWSGWHEVTARQPLHRLSTRSRWMRSSARTTSVLCLTCKTPRP